MIAKIEEFLAEQRWSENTRKRYRRALILAAGEVDIENLTGPGLRAWLESQGWGNSTQWVAYNAIRGFIRWKWGEDHPAMALKLKRSNSPPQRVLSKDKVRKLLYHFDTATVKGRRDLAMACVFLDSGLRVSEMCRLEMKYLFLDHLSLSVIVKGGDWKDKFFSPVTASYLSSWLADRENLISPEVKTVFASVGGNKPGHPLTRHGLQTIVKYWGLKSGIGKLSPHDFRRSFATIATLEGAPERVLMAAGGWSSEKSIHPYTRSISAEDILPYSPVMAVMR